MAARANLKISEEIREAFFQAQETRNVRILKLHIQHESIVLESKEEKAGKASEDFDSILPNVLQTNAAAFILFCLTDNDVGALSWCLLTWIPEGCKVRDKMLFSSSREDLKRTIGLGCFSSEYGANTLEDLTWKQYLFSIDKSDNADVMTENERLLQEEKVLISGENVSLKSTAMGVLPFELTPDAASKIAEFQQNGFNWIELILMNECFHLVSYRNVKETESFLPFINKDQASFVMLRLVKSDGVPLIFLIFSCPENIPIRIKMTMSSSKATLISIAKSKGIVFDRTLEIRSPEDIDDLIQSEIQTNINSSEPSGLLSAAGSSTATSYSHSKPQRPGKGKVKISKFVTDEN